MHGLVDDLMVAAIIACSALYALYALGPRGWRRRAFRGLANLMMKAPTGLRMQGAAGRLEVVAEAKSTGSCAGCDSCGTGASKNASAEIRISPSSIGKR